MSEGLLRRASVMSDMFEVNAAIGAKDNKLDVWMSRRDMRLVSIILYSVAVEVSQQ